MPHDAASPDRAAVCGPISHTTHGHADEARSGLVADRRTLLAGQAEWVGHRETVAEAVALRGQLGQGRIGQEERVLLHVRAKRRATRLRLRFHRLIDQLVEAGGFDEAMTILRHRKEELASRLARIGAQRPI